MLMEPGTVAQPHLLAGLSDVLQAIQGLLLRWVEEAQWDEDVCCLVARMEHELEAEVNHGQGQQ